MTLFAPSAPASSGPGPAELAALGADNHRRWFKRVLPRSLYGRSLLILILPLVLAQLIATWFFYDRHWDTVARRLSTGVASDIAFTLETLRMTASPEERQLIFERAPETTDMYYSYHPGERLPHGMRAFGSTHLEELLAAAIIERVDRPFQIDADFDPRDILVAIQTSNGVMQVAIPRKRLSTPTTYIFALWMAGSSLVLLAIASLFMRNQVKSLRRLAVAAEDFGKGRDVPNFKLEGASEVRQAGAAFLKMRARIQRQITQRTEMLAGVSHDLRTPITRMRLAVELMGEDASVGELKADLAAMQRMVQGYLDFARGEGSEEPRETDLTALVEEVAAAARRGGAQIFLALPEEIILTLRPDAMRRCLGNLVGNARHHAAHIWINAVPARDGVTLTIDDDGPGIPALDRENVFRPFVRLDASRNPDTGGLGLGLTIARDLARSHGGEITLEDSPQGGLRARLYLPR